MVGPGSKVKVDVGGGAITVGAGDGSFGEGAGVGDKEEEEDDNNDDDLLVESVDVLLGVIVAGFVGATVAVVDLGSFATRLLAVFLASSSSFFGMAFLSASQPLLTGLKKRLSIALSSSLQ